MLRPVFSVVQISYPMSKKLKSEFILVENEHFNNIAVNLTRSTVHVPTNVYEECESGVARLVARLNSNTIV